jgi:excisionase family DNA binding protein
VATIDPDATLGVLVNAIAEQVAAQVRTQLSTHLETAPRITPMLLNVKDAAVYLGRSEQALQHLIFQKEFPLVRVGRRVHLDRRDLDVWIEKNKF